LTSWESRYVVVVVVDVVVVVFAEVVLADDETFLGLKMWKRSGRLRKACPCLVYL
jgi:hypothetical protein